MIHSPSFLFRPFEVQILAFAQLVSESFWKMAHAQRGPEGFLTEVCRGSGDHLRVGKHPETSLEELNKISVDLGGSLWDRINGLTNCFYQIVTHLKRVGA